ncbi:MAG TPA: CotH kinase family protein [Acidobacteriota bacterium]|jgi:spore coat protein CotH
MLSAPARAQTADNFFDDTILHEIRLDIHPNDWQVLRNNFRSNAYYDCNFRWRYQDRDLLVENVAIRSRGGGTRSAAKPGLRVDFNRNVPGQTFLGLKSVILDNMTQDASMLRERLSMLFFQQMGLPASREAHARLFINNQYFGLYAIVESVDKDFLKRNFGEDNGYLFEYSWKYAYYLTYLGQDLSRYAEIFDPTTHENDSASALYGPIEAMTRIINQTPAADFERAAAEFLDLKLFVAHVAVENFLAESDGILGYAGINNFYFYRFQGKSLSQFIAWDKDNTFSAIEHPILLRIEENELMRRAMAVADLRKFYLETLARCALRAGGPYGSLELEIDRQYNQIHEAALEDPNKQCPDGVGGLKPCSNQEFEDGIEFLRQFARQRSYFVLRELGLDLPRSRRRP